MIRAGGATRPRLVRASRPARDDSRVSMVLTVLAGRPVDHVAEEWDVDPSLLDRWVRDFVVAGSGAITNRPDPDEARQRDRFMAALAHELRTPLATARGWAMLLCADEVPDDQVAEARERVLDSLTRLGDRIVDVELAAAVSLGRVPVDIQTVAVASLAGHLPGSPGVRRGAHLTTRADPKLLGRVLADLWSAAHRDPAPQRVAIDVVERGPWLEIRIVRDGVQINPMTLRAMFDPFDTNDDTTGVTLGLFIARALVVAHGGVLGAEGEDQRTVLFARLPRNPTVGS